MDSQSRHALARIDEASSDRTGELDPKVALQDRARAFSDWARRRLPRSYRVALAILRDEAGAQDAVHDAFLRAWEAWPKLRDPSLLDAWLDRIIVNGCRDRLRRKGRDSRYIRELRVVVDDRSPRQEALLRAMSRLSPDHRIVVVLRFFEDLSVDDIARQVGQKPGTVKSRLHYALSALRAAYDAIERE